MSIPSNVLKVHPADNVLVALTNLEKGTAVSFEGEKYPIGELVGPNINLLWLTWSRAIPSRCMGYSWVRRSSGLRRVG